MAVHVTRGHPAHDVRELTHATGRLVVTVGLEGASAYRDRTRTGIVFSRGGMTLAWAREAQGVRLFSGKETLCQVRVSLSAPALRRYAPTLAARLRATGGGLCALGQRTASARVMRLAQSLARGAGTADVLPVHALALGLTAEALRDARAAPEPTPRFSDAQVQALEHTQAMLQTSLARTPDLAGLALSAGMTTARWTAGFQWRFGCTPTQWLHEARMHEAWRRLAAGERVSTTAYGVGYPHPANFSTAFRRYFGVTPRAVPRASLPPGA